MKLFPAKFPSTCPRCLIVWPKGTLLKSRGYVRDGGYGFTHSDCPGPAKRKPTEPFPPGITPKDLLRINVPYDIQAYFPHLDAPVSDTPDSASIGTLIKCTECGQKHPRTFDCWDDYLSGATK